MGVPLPGSAKTVLSLHIALLALWTWALKEDLNVYVLQRMLGHSSLDMVKCYLAIAQADVQDAHRDASPVTNWCL
jgi:site-specific recombinase XerD